MSIATLKGYAGKQCNNFKETVPLKKKKIQSLSTLLYILLPVNTFTFVCELLTAALWLSLTLLSEFSLTTANLECKLDSS